MKEQTQVAAEPQEDWMPHRVPPERCCALDDGGNRCKSMGTLSTYYFGSTAEAGSGKPDWVRVVLCDKHASRTRIREANGCDDGN